MYYLCCIGGARSVREGGISFIFPWLFVVWNSYFQVPRLYVRYSAYLSPNCGSHLSQHWLKWRFDITLRWSDFVPSFWYRGPESILVSLREVRPGFLHGFLHRTPHVLDGCSLLPVSEFDIGLLLLLLLNHTRIMNGWVVLLDLGYCIRIKHSLQMTPLLACLYWRPLRCCSICGVCQPLHGRSRPSSEQRHDCCVCACVHVHVCVEVTTVRVAQLSKLKPTHHLLSQM